MHGPEPEPAIKICKSYESRTKKVGPVAPVSRAFNPSE
jgi:hypothetical protein